MTVLKWDKVGDRRYETGIDHGVLFPPNGPAVPWNGLTSVTETVSREVKSYYSDGVKYLDHHVPGSYAAKLSAFTYPDELESLLGTTEYTPGVYLHDQRAKLFNLSYRTLIGNDIDGTEHGYRIHIVYNVLAVPNDKAMDSMSNTVSVEPFEFDLSGTPNVMIGIRPTSHISIDSRKLEAGLLETIEAQIYGTPHIDDEHPGTDPSLPGFINFLALMGITP